MTTNAILYPADYVFVDSGPAKTGSSQVVTIDAAITRLAVQARDTALKATHTRRIGGQNAIDVQNRSLHANLGVMPLYQVSSTAVSIPFLGTQAIFGGGRGYSPGSIWADMSRLTYSGETYLPLNVFLSQPRIYLGTVSDVGSGKFCGGLSNDAFFSNVIDRVAFAELRMSRIAATLSQKIAGFAGGIGNKTYGYLIGGSVGLKFVRSGNRYTHSTDAVSYLGEILAAARISPHNGAGNRYSGYIFAGEGIAVGSNLPNGLGWWNPAYALSNAERLSYSSETTMVVSVTLDGSHTSHAVVGNETQAYIAGGLLNIAGSPGVSPFSNTIYAFTFGGETGALLSTTLTEAKICVDGASSQVSGYFIAGDTATSNWIGSTSIDRLSFESQTCSRIGVTTASPLSDQGATSDYAPGFSY